jgi:hypothetical protein
MKYSVPNTVCAVRKGDKTGGINEVFRAPKRRRGIATRYAKLTASFIAAIHVRCVFLYLPVHTT